MDDRRIQGHPAHGYHRDPDDEIDLAEVWRALIAGRRLILAVTAASTALALALALLLPPVYRAETLLSPVERAEKASSPLLQFGALEGFAGLGVGAAGGDAAEALATLSSRVFTDAFIREENVMPVLFAGRWDSDEKTWKADVEVPTAWDAYDLFDRKVRFVSKDVKTGLITLAIEWRDPEVAARWANRLVQRINAERRAEAIREAETNIAYLKEQLAETSLVEMQQAIYQLIEAKIKNIMVARSLDEYAFKVIDPAVAPQEFARPRRVAIVVLGFLLGALAASVAVLVRARFARQAGE
jgi:uncharacterized protein involved in exopolysaccharide biosynthesis